MLALPQDIFAAKDSIIMCNGKNGIQTAIGCISTDPTAFISKLLSFSIGIGGGIAFILLLLSGLKMQMSMGNPEKINEARELIESAITGLLLIIFSVFILKVIGVNVLSIPGFK